MTNTNKTKKKKHTTQYVFDTTIDCLFLTYFFFDWPISDCCQIKSEWPVL